MQKLPVRTLSSRSELHEPRGAEVGQKLPNLAWHPITRASSEGPATDAPSPVRAQPCCIMPEGQEAEFGGEGKEHWPSLTSRCRARLAGCRERGRFQHYALVARPHAVLPHGAR